METKNGLKSFISFLKENFLAIAITIVICTSFICSVSALVVSRKTASSVETLSQDYLNFANKVSVKLDDISDNIDFLRDWASNTPSITLGDTYLYHNLDANVKNNKVKNK